MKLFIWDLHGTLEQGNERAVLELSNIILKKFGFSERFVDYHAWQLYGLKWYQYFEFLLPDQSLDKHLELQAACFDLSHSPAGIKIIAKNIKPAQNALAVLDVIHKNHTQVLISNTMPDSLPIFIKALGMQQYFTSGNSLAVNSHIKDVKRTKADAFKSFIRSKQYDHLIAVGDSDGDMVFAKSIKAKAYLYAHKGLPFKSTAGDYRINDLGRLIDEC